MSVKFPSCQSKSNWNNALWRRSFLPLSNRPRKWEVHKRRATFEHSVERMSTVSQLSGLAWRPILWEINNGVGEFDSRNQSPFLSLSL